MEEKPDSNRQEQIAKTKEVEVSPVKKKKGRLPSAFTILALLTIFMAAMTWIVPAGKYDTETIETSAGEKDVAVKDTYKSAEDRIKKADNDIEEAKAAAGLTDAEIDDLKEVVKNAESEDATEEDKLQAEMLKEDEAFQAILAAEGEKENAEGIKNPQGIWDVLLAPVKGIKDTVDIFVTVMFVGGLLALEAKIGAIQAGFKVLMKRMKGKEKWLIPVLVALFAICGSAYGSQEETVVYYAFMVPLMMAAGYNAMTALLTVIVGTTVGIAASTVNPFSAIIAAELGGSNVGQGMLLRAIMLLVGVVIGSFFIMRYAEKVRAGQYKEDSVNDHKLKFAQVQDDDSEFDAKRKATLVIMFMALIFVTILAFIPWETLNITLFSDFTKWLRGLPVIGDLVGNVTPFGEWYFDELSVLYLISALALGFMYKLGDHKFVDTFIDGAKDVVGVCLIIGVARGITVVMNDGNITHTILHALESTLANLPTGAVKGLFGGVLYLIYLPLAFLIPSTSGLASVSMPIFGPLADLVGVGAPIAVAAFVAGSGIIQMLAPTVASLMGGTVACGISFNKYLKRVGLMALTLSVAYIVLITIASLTGFGV